MSNPITDFEFYQTNDVLRVAKMLLGKTITSRIGNETTSGMIVETEAYRGYDDRGCHAFGGRNTERTKSMFLDGGLSYVYICYGIHPMLNVVTGPAGTADAVLIRAIEPIEGLQIMQKRRAISSAIPTLTNGPGKCAVALGIEKPMDGLQLYDVNSPITISDGKTITDDFTTVGLRVGMSKHIGSCAYWPWRFYIKGNKWVSKPWVVKYDY